MEATLRQTLVWPNMRANIAQYVKTCTKCKLCKKQRKSYGKLPTKTAEDPVPWKRVNLDMIGSWTVQTPTKTHQLQALTMIDPATGWFEIKAVANAQANEIQAAFDDVWLSHYPRPQYLGYNNGNEYKKEFEQMRRNYRMQKRTSLEYNPQSNGIIERVHQVIGDMLRTFELEEMELDENDPCGPFMSAVGFAVRSTYHTTLEAMPA